tara:strand:+ start:162 stop:509 length:348 start_codon:yes stop_codon:yes gene_type:complete
MAKKTTTKKTATKKAVKKPIQRKKANKKQDDNSMGVMLLAGIGLILLIYFGSTVKINEDSSMDNNSPTKTEAVEKSIVISGKTYSSKSDAHKILKGIPQSILTNEERNFVEGYQD